MEKLGYIGRFFRKDLVNRPERNYKVEAVKHVTEHLTPWKVSVVSFAPATQMKDLVLLPGYEHFPAWQNNNASR